MTSNGLTDQGFSICLAPKGTTCSSNFMSDPNFAHEAAFLVSSWVLKSYPSSPSIWLSAHPWFRGLCPPESHTLSWFFPETVRAWLSICKHGGATEERGSGEMEGMGGASFALRFRGMPPPEGDGGDSGSEQGEQDKGRG